MEPPVTLSFELYFEHDIWYSKYNTHLLWVQLPTLYLVVNDLGETMEAFIFQFSYLQNGTNKNV
jgi:hypothetical protein